MRQLMLALVGCCALLAAHAAKSGTSATAHVAAIFAATGVATMLLAEGISELRKR